MQLAKADSQRPAMGLAGFRKSFKYKHKLGEPPWKPETNNKPASCDQNKPRPVLTSPPPNSRHPSATPVGRTPFCVRPQAQVALDAIIRQRPKHHRSRRLIKASPMLLFLFQVMLAASLATGPADAFCPYKCLCNDQSLSANCSQVATLSIVPMTLNPLLKRLTLTQLPIWELSNSLSVYRDLEYLNLSSNQLRHIKYENFNFRPAPGAMVLHSPASLEGPPSSSSDQSAGGKSHESHHARRLAHHLGQSIRNSLGADQGPAPSSGDDLRLHLRQLDLSDNRIEQLGGLADESDESMASEPPDNSVRPLRGSQMERQAPFLTLTRLELLSLAGNQLVQLRQHAFLGLVSLRELDLSRNQIELIDRHAFVGLIQLERLWLNENKLAKQLHPLSLALCRAPMVALEDFDLGDNGPGSKYSAIDEPALSSDNSIVLPNQMFTCAPWLRRLRLDGLQLRHVQVNAFDNLERLELLSMARNQLEQVPSDAWSYSNSNLSQSLRLLDLSETQIEFVNARAFSGLRALQRLSMNRMARLVSFDLSAFSLAVINQLPADGQAEKGQEQQQQQQQQHPHQDQNIEQLVRRSDGFRSALRSLLPGHLFERLSQSASSPNDRALQPAGSLIEAPTLLEQNNRETNQQQQQQPRQHANKPENKQQPTTTTTSARHRLINSQLMELELRHNVRLESLHSSLALRREHPRGRIEFVRLRRLDLQGSLELREFPLDKMIQLDALQAELLVDLSFVNQLNCSSCQLAWLVGALEEQGRRSTSAVSWGASSSTPLFAASPVGQSTAKHHNEKLIINSQLAACQWPTRISLDRLVSQKLNEQQTSMGPIVQCPSRLENEQGEAGDEQNTGQWTPIGAANFEVTISPVASEKHDPMSPPASGGQLPGGDSRILGPLFGLTINEPTGQPSLVASGPEWGASLASGLFAILLLLLAARLLMGLLARRRRLKADQLQVGASEFRWGPTAGVSPGGSSAGSPVSSSQQTAIGGDCSSSSILSKSALHRGQPAGSIYHQLVAAASFRASQMAEHGRKAEPMLAHQCLANGSSNISATATGGQGTAMGPNGSSGGPVVVVVGQRQQIERAHGGANLFSRIVARLSGNALASSNRLARWQQHSVPIGQPQAQADCVVASCNAPLYGNLLFDCHQPETKQRQAHSSSMSLMKGPAQDVDSFIRGHLPNDGQQHPQIGGGGWRSAIDEAQSRAQLIGWDSSQRQPPLASTLGPWLVQRPVPLIPPGSSSRAIAAAEGAPGSGELARPGGVGLTAGWPANAGPAPGDGHSSAAESSLAGLSCSSLANSSSRQTLEGHVYVTLERPIKHQHQKQQQQQQQYQQRAEASTTLTRQRSKRLQGCELQNYELPMQPGSQPEEQVPAFEHEARYKSFEWPSTTTSSEPRSLQMLPLQEEHSNSDGPNSQPEAVGCRHSDRTDRADHNHNHIQSSEMDENSLSKLSSSTLSIERRCNSPAGAASADLHGSGAAACPVGPLGNRPVQSASLSGETSNELAGQSANACTDPSNHKTSAWGYSQRRTSAVSVGGDFKQKWPLSCRTDERHPKLGPSSGGQPERATAAVANVTRLGSDYDDYAPAAESMVQAIGQQLTKQPQELRLNGRSKASPGPPVPDRSHGWNDTTNDAPGLPHWPLGHLSNGHISDNERRLKQAAMLMPLATGSPTSKYPKDCDYAINDLSASRMSSNESNWPQGVSTGCQDTPTSSANPLNRLAHGQLGLYQTDRNNDQADNNGLRLVPDDNGHSITFGQQKIPPEAVQTKDRNIDRPKWTRDSESVINTKLQPIASSCRSRRNTDANPELISGPIASSQETGAHHVSPGVLQPQRGKHTRQISTDLTEQNDELTNPVRATNRRHPGAKQARSSDHDDQTTGNHSTEEQQPMTRNNDQVAAGGGGGGGGFEIYSNRFYYCNPSPRLALACEASPTVANVVKPERNR